MVVIEPLSHVPGFPSFRGRVPKERSGQGEVRKKGKCPWVELHAHRVMRQEGKGKLSRSRGSQECRKVCR